MTNNVAGSSAIVQMRPYIPYILICVGIAIFILILTMWLQIKMEGKKNEQEKNEIEWNDDD